MTNLPLVGDFTITAAFKEVNRKLWKTLGYHTGIDFVGSDNIYATCNGVVDTVSYSSAYGNYIIVKEDGVIRYHYFAHLSSIKVALGSIVTRNTIIGIMGATGNVTAKHLHYEIRIKKTLRDDVLVNPADYCGIPNVRGTYNSVNYQVSENVPNISYQAHIQNIGWQNIVSNGAIAGTLGKDLRIEAIKISSDIDIQYRVHMEGIGWGEWVPKDCMAGTIGENRRIEAIELISSYNNIRGQANIQDRDWLPEQVGTHIILGTVGQNLKLEAFKFKFM